MKFAWLCRTDPKGRKVKVKVILCIYLHSFGNSHQGTGASLLLHGQHQRGKLVPSTSADGFQVFRLVKSITFLPRLRLGFLGFSNVFFVGFFKVSSADWSGFPKLERNGDSFCGK